MGELIAFYGLATLITLLSLATVLVPNPVTAAILLVLDLFCLAGVYGLLGADFIAGIQVIIYAGAILVLFLFVVMLLNLSLSDLRVRMLPVRNYFLLGVFITSFLWLVTKLVDQPSFVLKSNPAYHIDHTYAVAAELFIKYLWPFELSSLLILLAVVSSVVIAKKPITSKKR